MFGYEGCLGRSPTLFHMEIGSLKCHCKRKWICDCKRNVSLLFHFIFTWEKNLSNPLNTPTPLAYYWLKINFSSWFLKAKEDLANPSLVPWWLSSCGLLGSILYLDREQTRSNGRFGGASNVGMISHSLNDICRFNHLYIHCDFSTRILVLRNDPCLFRFCFPLRKWVVHQQWYQSLGY